MNKRCEMILRELENEEKIKVWWDFKFPEKEPLELRLKDMLEEQVDEKYYLSDVQVNKIQTSEFMQEKKRIQEKDYSDTILARNWKDPKCVRIGNIYGEDKGTGYAGNVWDKENLSPTLTNMQGGNRQPMILEEPQLITQQEEKILIKNATKKGYDEAIDGDSINLSYPESTTRRGRVGHGVAQTLQCNDSMGVVQKEYERTPLKFLNRNQKNIDGDYAFCVDSCNTGGVKEIDRSNLRIRKLTAKECYRLMRVR